MSQVGQVPEMKMRSEVRDGMRIDWNAPIPMDDGIILRADIFRPIAEGKYPVIMTYGIYAKGLSYEDGYPMQWGKLITDYPEILEGSTNKYQNWETTDPERWVPHGYVVIRVDSRGAGCSPGLMDPNSAREIDDTYLCIEWAAAQPWSNGKVGMLGISYYSFNQWRVATKHPPHLAAIIPWEGQNDNYRDSTYHGGILNEMRRRWAKHQVVDIQYGRGDKAKKNPNTGESVAGPTLSEEEMAKNRVDVYEESKKHPLFDDWHRTRYVDLSQVKVPLLSCANWGGQGMHPRGNFNGFIESASKQKWLEVHGDSHWSLFSAGYGLALQKRFFDYFLKGIDNGWEREQPRVLLNIRHPGPKFVPRAENEWPLARTQWTKFYLDPASKGLSSSPVAKGAGIEYEAMGNGLTFSMPPLAKPTEITGPIAAKLFISSSTKDADLFLVVRVFDPQGKELTFMGSTDPNTPIANGWLRASHRRLDPARTLPYRPYHPHDRVEPLTPGEIYELDIEIVSTCIAVPAGWRVGLTVRGKDYEYEGELDEFGKKFHYGTRGTGGMTHNDPDSRPADVFGGKVKLYAGGQWGSYLLLPIIP